MDYAQDECLDVMPPSVLNIDGYIPTAENQITDNRRFERRARELWQIRLPAPNRSGDLDELRLFTTMRDPALRAHFCREFIRLFPNDPDHGCPADRPPPATIVTEAGDIPLIGPWPTH